MRNVYLTLKTSVAILLLLFCQGVLAQPVITSFSPASGPVGTTVTITGSGFSATPGNNVVFFGADKGTVQSATTTTLTVTVPTGATYSPVTVTTNQLTGYSRVPFILTFATGDAPFTPSSFRPKIELTGNAQGRDVAIVDLNGDGKPDVISSNSSLIPNTITILRNATVPNNSPNFTSVGVYATGLSPYGMATGDLDGDGKPDVAVANFNNGLASTVSVFRNSSVGDTIILDTARNYATGNSTLRVVIADIDNDGKPDLAAVNSNSYTISIFRNTTTTVGNITFAPKIDITGGFSDIALGDIDGDGKVDLASLNVGTFSNMEVWRNLSTPGAISFGPKLSFATVAGPFDLKMGDLNGDGKPDAVVTNYGGKKLSIFKNTSTTGNISFGVRQDYVTGSSPKRISIGDLNGDGKPDISITTDTPKVIAVYRNISISDTIRIDTAVGYSTGYVASSNNSCDMDGDGRPDLVTSNGTNVVSIIRNRQGEPPLLLTSFTPTSGGTGTEVTIFGKSLSRAVIVRFGNVTGNSLRVLSDTVIKAKVGAGATGDVTVVTADGTVTKAGFTFIRDTTPVCDTPGIISFTPTSGVKGTTITIFGSHFTGATAARFGGVLADSMRVLSDSTISAIVGNGASGPVSVTTPCGTTSKPGFTFIHDTIPLVCDTPRIILFNPTSGGKGTIVTIFGAHFTGATAVRFGGVLADSVIINSDTVITAIVDTGATGAVSVTTSCGTAFKSGFTFIPDSTGAPDSLFARIGAGNTNTTMRSFALYPNPASGCVIWQQPATDHKTQLQIIDITGRIVKTISLGKNAVQTTIPVSGLPTGMYKLLWSDGKNKLTKSLLIK